MGGNWPFFFPPKLFLKGSLGSIPPVISMGFSKSKGFQGKPSHSETVPLLELTDVPSSYDWRQQGYTNAVKDQGQCGSCWAFAAVANIEGAGFVSTGKLASLSEQQLNDCDKDEDQGCDGGLPESAYKDMIAHNMGLESESDYRYTGRDGTCTLQADKEIAFVGDWTDLSQDEDQIAAALVKYGPLALGINAGLMQFYSGGVANPSASSCKPADLDHGVSFVAFGEDSGSPYWTIRNSWGSSWGEAGHYRIMRGTGACGLNTAVTTALDVTIGDAPPPTPPAPTPTPSPTPTPTPTPHAGDCTSESIGDQGTCESTLDLVSGNPCSWCYLSGLQIGFCVVPGDTQGCNGGIVV